MVSILLGNIALFLKFELISHKVGLVFLRWNLIHVNFFVALCMTATNMIKNCVMFQKRIALHKIIFAFKVREGF